MTLTFYRYRHYVPLISDLRLTRGARVSFPNIILLEVMFFFPSFFIISPPYSLSALQTDSSCFITRWSLFIYFLPFFIIFCGGNVAGLCSVRSVEWRIKDGR